MKIGVIIPALNEEGSVGEVVRRCLAQCGPDDVMRVEVCDNGSRDGTANKAREAGAEVVAEPERGYGAACLKAIDALGDWPDLYVFTDADGSSLPEEMGRLIEPIRADQAELVLGHRLARPGSMTPPQRFGSWLAVALIGLRWGVRYRDLGPFRAIRRTAYERLEMADRTWGWTVEMQIKALQREVRPLEVDVSWVARIAGQSKISGTAMGVARAGSKILWIIARHGIRRNASKSPFLDD